MADDGMLSLNEPLETDEGPVSVIPIIREGDEAPWNGTLKWADERPMCGLAHEFLEGNGNINLKKCSSYARGMCKGAGMGGPKPCIFHERLDSPVWLEAAQYRYTPDRKGLVHVRDYERFYGEG